MWSEPSAADETPAIESVVGALDDDGCRAIVTALETPMTAEEIAVETGLPRSTTYRKLDQLTEASLVTELEPVAAGHGTARYVADFESVAIDLDERRRFRVRIRRATSRMLGMWAAVSQKL
ncbi:winged helix-turn-helix domain-containing protein [Natrarchaeobaculum aegyptiacum]|uniref:Transcriptional regulator n=1 Tax=Natrarchaeobaculum aegyptiacum TaxID=745377 RepID=A0A2Z2HP43_9EURY|nr:winged helix-turn-helix domain-containing protein [Natrarchaeobaculum aegyptiacum]ARS88692.1 hypothetical protein B1756_02255 [Natrarchaeobaculum aegyptiacum]